MQYTKNCKIYEREATIWRVDIAFTKNTFFLFNFFDMIGCRKDVRYQPYRARSEPVVLKILRILNKRSKLAEDDYRYYLNQEKGFQGEVQFDVMTENLQRECYILNDLLLESNKSSFQLDSSLFFKKLIPC